MEKPGRRLSEGIRHRDLGRVHRNCCRCDHRRPITTKDRSKGQPLSEFCLLFSFEEDALARVFFSRFDCCDNQLGMGVKARAQTRAPTVHGLTEC